MEEVSQSGTAVYGAFVRGLLVQASSLMQLKHKTSETLFAYWDKVRGNRATPRRFEIDPGQQPTGLRWFATSQC